MLTSLLAMQQADAAFPSGAFAFSNGIEGLAARHSGAIIEEHDPTSQGIGKLNPNPRGSGSRGLTR